MLFSWFLHKCINVNYTLSTSENFLLQYCAQMETLMEINMITDIGQTHIDCTNKVQNIANV